MENSNVQDTLNERNGTHGDFETQAATAQVIKEIIREKADTETSAITPDMAEALDMIASKISRILHGDPTHTDSWHDIAGYATLIANRLEHGRSHLIAVEPKENTEQQEREVVRGQTCEHGFPYNKDYCPHGCF